MKKITILSAIIVIAFSSCNKGGGSTDPASCWLCKIEGNHNGTVIDIDTTICEKNQAGINEFMSPYNTNGQIATCDREPL